MADFDLGLDENIELRIFIDKSVVEVYVNNRQYLAARVYPGLQESQGVSLKAQGGSSKVISVDAWEMKNTWNLGVKEWKSTSVWR